MNEIDAWPHGAPAVMTFQSVTRSAGAGLMVSLQSSQSTGTGQLLVTNAGALRLIGGGGASGTTTISILPYALGAGLSFLTYDRGADGLLGTADDVGLRPLNFATEYAPTITPQTLSAANVRLNSNQMLASNATINALGLNGTALTLASGAKLTVSSGALVLTGSGGVTAAINGTGSLDFGTAEVVVNADGQGLSVPPRYQIDVPIAAAGSLTKLGDGALVLSQANTYSGTTYITSGTLVSDVSGAFGTSAIQFTTNLGSLSFEGQDQTHSNSITLSGQHPTLISVAEGISVTLTGGISGGDGFTKVGSGMLRMTAVGSDSFGPSYVRDGILRMDGKQTGLPLTVTDGGTLAGSGEIGGTVEIDTGGTLDPGAGSSNGTSAIKLFSQYYPSFVMKGGTFKVRLNGTTPGDQYDQLILQSGLYQLSDSPQLDVSITYPANVGDQFMILDNSYYRGTMGGEGTFAGLQNGSTFMADGDDLRINWLPNGSITLTVIATPEPSVVLLFGIGAAALVLRRPSLRTGNRNRAR